MIITQEYDVIDMYCVEEEWLVYDCFRWKIAAVLYKKIHRLKDAKIVRRKVAKWLR